MNKLVNILSSIIVNQSNYYSVTNQKLSKKVDKQAGKGLSTNDYSDSQKAKLYGLPSSVYSKQEIDANTSSVNLDLSGKVDKVDGMGLSTNDYTNQAVLEVAKISPHISDLSAHITQAERQNWNQKEDSFSESHKLSYSLLSSTPFIPSHLSSMTQDSIHRTVTETQILQWNDKVDSIAGKQLSTEDFSTVLKTKLTNIEQNAQVNIIQDVKVNNQSLDITDKSVNITIPTKVSQLTDDIGLVSGNLSGEFVLSSTLKNDYYTKTQVQTAISNAQHLKKEIVDQLPPLSSAQVNIIYLVSKSQTENDSYNEYLKIDDKWEKVGNTEIELENYYTKADINSGFVSASVYTNDKSNFALTSQLFSKKYQDLITKPVLSTLTDDVNHRTVTDIQISGWNNKQDYISLINKLDYSLLSSTPNIPTALSSLSEDINHKFVTNAEKLLWNAKQPAITLSDKLDYKYLSGIPTNYLSSAITDQSHRTVTEQEKSDWYSKQDLITSISKLDYSLISGIPSDIGKSYTAGSGLVLNGTQFSISSSVALKQDLPTKFSDLTNDGNYASYIITGNSTSLQPVSTQTVTYSAGSGLMLVGTTFSISSTVALKSDLPTKTSDLTNDDNFVSYVNSSAGSVNLSSSSTSKMLVEEISNGGTIQIDKCYKLIMTGNTTLNAVALDSNYTASSKIFINPGSYVFTPGNNLSVINNLVTNKINECQLTWFNGTCKLIVIGSF